MNTSETNLLETNDMQGLLIRSYTNLPVANFLLCQARDKSSLTNFLKIIFPKITNGAANPMEVAMNIALTNKGIGMLQLAMKVDFAEDFMEGMDSDFRARILGDYNQNDQKYWHWGAKHQPEIHFMLMLYAADQITLQNYCNDSVNILSQHNITVIRVLDSKKLEGEKEHFGFHDGISQPVLKSMQHKKPGSPDNVVAEGEFIFGYCNEYNQMPISPALSSNVDIGKNGSYMVFRQIAQDVQSFWQYVADKNNGDLESAVHLASKMIGRYPSGTPIVFSPEKDLANSTATEANDFRYADDQHGYKCPVGAHIRKANPRDRIGDDPVESIIVAKRHRILRRGRPYGDPIAPSFLPADILNASPQKDKEVGLYFVAFNTNISRQFEFIQQQWMNNKKFGALYNDPDPIAGVDAKPAEDLTEKLEGLGQFTIQAEPVRKKLVDVPPFTAVKGGAYFFMPGLHALQVMSNS
jgi:Dyp-type peroxidase family